MTNETKAEPPSDAGPATWAAFFQAMEAAQRERKQSLEQRGVSVLTSSGAVVTLLFGLVALIADDESFVLPKQAHGPLGLALFAFGAAAVLGILANSPRKYRGLDPKKLKAKLGRYFDDDSHDANLRIARAWFDIYEAATERNRWKAYWVVGAMAAQVVGVVAVAVAVGEVLAHR